MTLACPKPLQQGEPVAEPRKRAYLATHSVALSVPRTLRDAKGSLRKNATYNYHCLLGNYKGKKNTKRCGKAFAHGHRAKKKTEGIIYMLTQGKYYGVLNVPCRFCSVLSNSFRVRKLWSIRLVKTVECNTPTLAPSSGSSLRLLIFSIPKGREFGLLPPDGANVRVPDRSCTIAYFIL